MTHHEIFTACFPALPIPAEIFPSLARLERARVIPWLENGETVAFAAVEGETLRLLLVHPAWQGRGIGTALLSRAEEAVRRNGGRAIRPGGPDARLFIGAPESCREFFSHRGYETQDAYDEMTGDLNRLLPADALDAPPDVTFGWYAGGLDALQKAVGEVDASWVQYFPSAAHVFCAMRGGRIASFCFADVSDGCLLSNGKNRVGVPGCVGTVPAFRRQGIGLKMVALACQELRRQGCDTAFIHYTGVAHWYARLGFRTVLHEYFMEKTLAV